MKTSLFDPIPEVAEASVLLAGAGECLMKGEIERAEAAILESDRPQLLDWFNHVARPRQWNPNPSRSPLPTDRQSPRMQPGVDALRELHARDGYRCRYCSIRVIDRDVFTKLRRLFPDTLRWGRGNADQHAGLLCTRASHDHVLPRAYGGVNALGNYVTACWLCQFGRGDSLLEDLGISNPLFREPLLDEWDGLRRILTL